ncbi:response regulator transcription factor [Geomonas sp.]|uniref:response regulator transcription factor n=1 Tax=Geomonas sp. TaxID=2651584 RepID=UPI002B4A37D8|nr:response regulator [Geomonas sp.]HJV33941.1 response regulator [Geomonas sp.]
MGEARKVRGAGTRLHQGIRTGLDALRNPGSPLSVLIAEDDQVTSRTMGLMIAWEFPHLTVDTVDNGERGVELFRQRLPDIVIADLDLPGKDGLQMAAEIKTLKKETPLIVVTGCSDRTQLARLCEIGVNHCILKPYKVQELFAAIESCIAQLTKETDVRSYTLF